MRLLRILAPVACVLAAVTTCPAPFAALAGATEGIAHRALGKNHSFCRIYLDPTDKFTRIGPPSEQRAALRSEVPGQSEVTLAQVQVTYIGFNAQAQAAFQAAVDIWATQVQSSVPIKVDATFEAFDEALLLGAAGPTCAFPDFTGSPRANTFFPVALANRLAGSDLLVSPSNCSNTNDISASFNSSAAWYYGTDGLTPSGQVDFVSVVLHELGHGLGFFAEASYTATTGSGSIGSGGTPYIYDTFPVDSSGVSLLNTSAYPNPSTAIGNVLRGGNLFWNGTQGKNANGGTRPKLYAPTSFTFGSSYLHLDEATYGPGNINSLMSPRIGQAESIHTPGPITLGMFTDMGWGNQTGGSCSFALDAANATVAATGRTGLSGTNQALRVTVSASTGCAWTASSASGFLTVSSGASGTGSGVVRIDVAPNTGGGRSGTVTIAGITYTVSQTADGPAMAIDRSSLTFSAVTNGSAFTSKTGTQSVRLTQAGAGTVTWTATSNASWLRVANGSGAASNQASGSGSATINISVQFASSLLSSQTGTVTLAFTGAGNTAGPVTVTLNTLTSTAAVAPFGSFDTPTDGITGVAGSIAVTGWALDDVGTTQVRIMRSPVAGEGTADIFIGNAVFIDGARDDIQSSFPSFPLSSRAGWGYLLLTNFLPNTGNGTFTLKAFADDADGHTALLGSKLITCDNLNSIAPFGAIDTPGQGETIGGVYLNAGWVLSPGTRRADGAHGGTVAVFADGVNLGSPSGWGARSDIQALFPVAQYSGTNDAVAGFGLDTTTMTNGVHSIFWIVTATSGGSAGVGSRYVTVSNGNLRLDPSATTSSNVIDARPALEMPRAAARRMTSAATLASEVDAAPLDLRAIRGRRGFDLDTPLADYAAAAGRIVVQSEELDRVELHLADGGRHQYTGYLRAFDGVRPLPVGSALDAATGLFTWGVGPGFVGSYDLSFVRWSNGRAVARQDVRVVLNPKGSNRLGTQLVIDVPSPDGNAVVGREFFVSGWAADLDSAVDRGVDTVHVWAYPVNERGAYDDPLFVGPAVFDGERPDVAAVYGARFGNSGYGIIVKDLAPGTYDIAVFAYSTVRGGFAPAKTVRVTVR